MKNDIRSKSAVNIIIVSPNFDLSLLSQFKQTIFNMGNGRVTRMIYREIKLVMI